MTRGCRPFEGRWHAGTRAKKRRPRAGEDTGRLKGMGIQAEPRTRGEGPVTTLSPSERPFGPGLPSRWSKPIPGLPAPTILAGRPSLRNLPASRRHPSAGTTSLFRLSLREPCCYRTRRRASQKITRSLVGNFLQARPVDPRCGPPLGWPPRHQRQVPRWQRARKRPSSRPA